MTKRTSIPSARLDCKITEKNKIDKTYKDKIWINGDIFVISQSPFAGRVEVYK